MLYAEDLAVGQRFELGSCTISEEEIVGFAKQYDPVPIHTDKEAVATGPFGGLIASGFNTLAIYQRLIVEAVWTQVAGIVGRSFEVRLSHPVRPGTLITGHSQNPKHHPQAKAPRRHRDLQNRAYRWIRPNYPDTRT
jgi:acyl dehydratase